MLIAHITVLISKQIPNKFSVHVHFDFHGYRTVTPLRRPEPHSSPCRNRHTPRSGIGGGSEPERAANQTQITARIGGRNRHAKGRPIQIAVTWGFTHRAHPAQEPDRLSQPYQLPGSNRVDS